MSSWADHYRRCPPDWLLLKRVASELVELRVLLFNIHRDPKKSPAIMPEQIAPDLFGHSDPEVQERQAFDDFGKNLFTEIYSDRDSTP